MVLGLFWSWSWWQRSLENNFPADPELRRAVTETKMSAELSVTMVISGEVLTLGLETKLTKFTLWYSPIGHTKITCPPEPQYKQESLGQSMVPLGQRDACVVDLHRFVVLESWGTLADDGKRRIAGTVGLP